MYQIFPRRRNISNTNQTMVKLGVSFFIFASLALCADSVDLFPEDCDERLKAMDDAMKVGLVITNPKPVTFKTPRDLVRNYCV